MQKNADLQEPLINRVAQSALQSIDLEDLYPVGEIVEIDLANRLHQGLILREKDFRNWIKEHDWQQYQKKHVAVSCSADAIIPVWAYMLVTSKLADAASVMLGTKEMLLTKLYEEQLDFLSLEDYRDAKVVIKGCSKKAVPQAVYVSLTKRLLPVVASIMYGEPCSTVPVFKKPRA